MICELFSNLFDSISNVEIVVLALYYIEKKKHSSKTQ